MKPLFLVLALPVLLTGCAAYVGDAGPGPGYYNDGYYAGGPGYYGGSVVDVGYYGSDRGYYHHDRDYRHYDGGGYQRSAYSSRGNFQGNNTRVVNVTTRNSGRTGGGRSAASVSAEHIDGGEHHGHR